MTEPSRDKRLLALARRLAFDPEDPLRAGGNYVGAIQRGRDVFVSGQIPRVGDRIAVLGAAGREATLDEAQRAAELCATRCLLLLKRTLGSLGRIERISHVTTYVRSAADFTQQSEVADAASRLMIEVLDEAGVHTRTAVGVLQLPKERLSN